MPEIEVSADHIATVLGAVMCPPEHDGTKGIFADGSRCYVCIARALAADLEQAWNHCSTCGEMSGGGAYGCEECSEFLSEASLAEKADLEAAEARVEQLEAELKPWRESLQQTADAAPNSGGEDA